MDHSEPPPPFLLGFLATYSGRARRPGSKTGPRHTFKHFLYLGGTASELVAPKLIALILDELNKSNEQSPLKEKKG